MLRGFKVLTMVGLLLSPTTLDAATPATLKLVVLSEEGTVVSTNWEDGLLILENGDEYRYLAVDIAAPIQNDHGTALTLRDIRPGDTVQYNFEIFNRLWIATEIRVIPRANAAPAGGRHGDASGAGRRTEDGSGGTGR
jgi:hypothetical protein